MEAVVFEKPSVDNDLKRRVVDELGHLQSAVSLLLDGDDNANAIDHLGAYDTKTLLEWSSQTTALAACPHTRTHLTVNGPELDQVRVRHLFPLSSGAVRLR